MYCVHDHRGGKIKIRDSEKANIQEIYNNLPLILGNNV